MIDPRLQKLGDTIVYHSCEIKPGDKVILETSKNCYPLIKHILKRCYEIGAIPFVMLKESDIQSILMSNATEEQVRLQTKYESYIMQDIENCKSFVEIDLNKHNGFGRFNEKPNYTYFNIDSSINCFDYYDIYDSDDKI